MAMAKIPDFILNGSATLVSTWIQLKENGMRDHLKMVEFCGSHGIAPPVCMVLMASDLSKSEIYENCKSYCKEAYSIFSSCENVSRLEIVCKIYAAQITDTRFGYHELDSRLHTIARACLNKKIPRKVRDFVAAPTAGAVGAAYRVAALSLVCP